MGLLLGAGLVVAAGASSSVARAAGDHAAKAAHAARMVAGPPGARAAVLDLSAAHALVREFGVDSAFAVGDAALARVLADDALGAGVDRVDATALRALLARYADELTGVVALPARSAALPEARVNARDGVAFVRPGTGASEVPEGVGLVVLDLRDLPASDALDPILARSVGPLLASDVERPSRLVRHHDGPVDEVFSEFNAYSTTWSYRTDPAIAGTGARDVPLVLLLGTRVSPQAASFAAALRAAGRAWIAGAGVPLEIAESTWQGVGAEGLMVRTSELATLAPEVRSESSGQVVENDIQIEDIEITPDSTWRVSLSGPAEDDLNLYLARDVNEDGVFDGADEIVLSSEYAGSEESLELIGALLPSGPYLLIVYGNVVRAVAAPFTLERQRARATRLPDVIAADLTERLEHVGDAVALRERLQGATPPALTGVAARSRPALASPFGFYHPVAQSRGVLRADLLIAHGVLRLFYPYLPEVGNQLDARLLETLQAVDDYSGSDRIAASQILRRFGEALRDGHHFVNAPVPGVTLPAFLEYVGGRPMVRRSLVDGIHPGDTIVALDSRPIDEVYSEELARTSAATDGHRFDLAERFVLSMSEPRSLTLQDTFGVQRTVSIDPQPQASRDAVIAPVESDRPSGTLADLGAPELYYLNLNAASTPTLDAAVQALDEANAGSLGMILDMRGYFAFNHQDLAARLIQEPFNSPAFEHRVYVGPGEPTTVVDQYTIEPIESSAFGGPMVLLTGPHAVSASENFMQMLVGADRLVAVVGRQSAGTNGNVTGLTLPGGFIFSYSGLEVHNPDGSRFFGVGIVPDHEVPIRAEDLRDGIDRALLEAVCVLREGEAAPVRVRAP